MVRHQKIHFIAIGGSIMHSLAIELKRQGWEVSGSDDEIFEPSRSRLAAHGLLPEKEGWFPERVHNGLDAVIVGMHAKADNPELQKAQTLGIPVYSFPEFIYRFAEDKQRIVVAGSHGKTTITSMIMHVLHHYGRSFDYVVGAKVEGFENNLRLSEEAPVIVIEGDEYPAAVFSPEPKYCYYHPHITVISGIAWDHANVYPEEAVYVQQFEKLAELGSVKAGSIVYNKEDVRLSRIVEGKERPDVSLIAYETHPYRVQNGRYELKLPDKRYLPVEVFGKHNMANIAAAKAVCLRIGITEDMFYEAIRSFKGAQRRLQLISENGSVSVFSDFAHAPSKVRASIAAVKERNPDRRLLACLELHSYSSLNQAFLPQYADSMKAAEVRVVYFNPKKLKQKGLPDLQADTIRRAFNDPDLHVFDDSQAMQAFIEKHVEPGMNVLLMSSGNFDNLDLQAVGQKLCINS
ncbi:UDP-N-acetylmuramate--L-alanine ligase [Thermonema rossianum]|uniref:UDP-N-acetylmuramate--L-alanine ligase n=1 Tax=Thermonema rossianum TaxID=55505 RepID=UPI00056EB7BD|nr:Mur ligase domain-containing protein [Thermonema rossianum]